MSTTKRVISSPEMQAMFKDARRLAQEIYAKHTNIETQADFDELQEEHQEHDVEMLIRASQLLCHRHNSLVRFIEERWGQKFDFDPDEETDDMCAMLICDKSLAPLIDDLRSLVPGRRDKALADAYAKNQFKIVATTSTKL